MKIALFDTNMGKFTKGMVEHWRTQGHEVTYFHTYHLPFVEDADVVWFDCVDGNLVCATREYADSLRGKKVIARAIDIDVWARHFTGVEWSQVSHLVFIARHIRDYVTSTFDVPSRVKVHHVPCGVDTDKFSLRRSPAANTNVAFVGSLWHGKGIDLLFQFVAALPDFEFHVCGKWGLGSLEERWYRPYIDQFLSHYTNWRWVESVPDVNDWLEDKTYALVCSKKEAFSYFAAEAMAKGLMPLIHEFYGARDIWPSDYLWREISVATARIRHAPYRPHEYRNYVERKYPFSEMMRRFDELLAG